MNRLNRGVRPSADIVVPNLSSAQARGLLGWWSADSRGTLRSPLWPQYRPTHTGTKVLGSPRTGPGSYFDGTLEASTGAFDLTGYDDFTVAFWAIINTGSPQFGRLLEYGTSQAFTINMNQSSGSNRLTFTAFNNTIFTPTTVIGDNKLHHVVCVRKKATLLSVRIDGTDYQTSADGSSNAVAKQTLYFARYGGGGFRGIATFFDVRIYGRPLEINEQVDLFFRPWDLYGGPQSRLPMLVTAFLPQWASMSNQIIGAQPC